MMEEDTKNLLRFHGRLTHAYYCLLLSPIQFWHNIKKRQRIRRIYLRLYCKVIAIFFFQDHEGSQRRVHVSLLRSLSIWESCRIFNG